MGKVNYAAIDIGSNAVRLLIKSIDREAVQEKKIKKVMMLRVPPVSYTHLTLAESVSGDHIDQVDNFDFIYAQIKNLRKRLKEAGATPELKAVHGFGYKMVVE